MSAAAPVRSEQRYLRGRRCPICNGADNDPRGRGKRCTGFVSEDFAHCSREEHAGDLTANDQSGTYAHRLRGPCRCGHTHGELEQTDRKIDAIYDYHDEQGALAFQVIRFEGKTFRQRRPLPGGGFEWKTSGMRRVLYRLPELLAADPKRPVWIAEGEKDVESLHARGLIATTNPMGAKKWAHIDECARKALADRHVIVLPDADADGDEHAKQVVEALRGVAASIRRIDLPSKDVSEWFAAGGSTEQLLELIDKTEPIFEKPPDQAMAILAEDVAAQDTSPIRSYGSGFADLDRLLDGGISTRQVTTLLGPPGAGKSAMAVSIATHLEHTHGLPVLYASTELESHELMARFAGNILDRPWSAIARGRTPKEWSMGALRGRSLYLLGSEIVPRDGDLALRLIEQEAKRIAERHGVPPLVVVDYLQDLARGNERDVRAKTGDLATSCRAASQRLDGPMLVVSSVARTFYGPRKRDELRALDDPEAYLAAAKESGDIDYASAVVLFLDVDDDRTQPERAVRIAAAKVRHGEPGFAGARFVGATGRFTSDVAAAVQLSAPGRAETNLDSKRDERCAKIVALLDRMQKRDERHLATIAYIKSNTTKIGSDHIKPTLDYLEHRKVVRVETIERLEGKGAKKKLRSREIYVLTAYDGSLDAPTQGALDVDEPTSGGLH